MTDISMSHQTVHRITQDVAEKIAQSSSALSETLRKPKVLYIEGDGV
ncbi:MULTISPECIES: hypothetical protein [Streptococcus]|nr:MULTISPECIES: hypothetical protein [Streptococcus]EGJ45169.1 hypothetical protein HMPREF9396_0082 [Streptococcus sanguinis SK1059]EGQ22269.1 hypothetical protein HMPREF8573_0080 [Streptococcus sanguinis ATCC 29667]EGQ24831.1 hypothetical protein HMPREF9387_0658 [Streptococcus sanguinis SK340]MBF1722318.1 hypothetical protein [Streptococcus sp.]WNU94259.1 hypothetical protein RSK81_09380 [Streptococcus sp. DTU_2020_1000888_1_SI_GRL_NUU_041A]